MVSLGHDSTVPVTMEDMIRHAAAVARGATRPFLVADLPFGSYLTLDTALANGARLIQEGGMQAVKLEGGRSQAHKIAALVREGIPVMGHVGLLPQTARAVAGYTVRGATADEACAVVADALAVVAAGAFAVVLEKVPAPLAAFITAAIAPVPTIGIGAGPDCAGQVLVAHDALGMLPPRVAPLRFVKEYADVATTVSTAAAAYATDVRERTFPSRSKHSFSMRPDVANAFIERVVDAEVVTAAAATSGSAIELPVISLPHDVRTRALAALASASTTADSASNIKRVTLLESGNPVSDTNGEAVTAVDATKSVPSRPDISGEIHMQSHPAPLRILDPQRSFRVAIVGSGSLAQLFAVRLSAVADVTIVTSSILRAESLVAAGGVRVVDPDGTGGNASRRVLDGSLPIREAELLLPSSAARVRVVPRATALAEDLHRCQYDIVLVLTKAHAAGHATSVAHALTRRTSVLMPGGRGYILPLFNGGYATEYMRKKIAFCSGSMTDKIEATQILCGVTSQGATQIAAPCEADMDATVVVPTGVGDTIIAETGCADAAAAADAVTQLLRTAGLPAVATAVPENVVRWSKIAMNAVLLPPAALLGLANGGVSQWYAAAQARGRTSLLDVLAREVAEVMAHAIPGLDNAEHLSKLPGWSEWPRHGSTSDAAQLIVRNALRLASATAPNVSTMLSDLRSGRPSEVRFINGFVCDSGIIAQRHGTVAPTHRAIVAHILQQQRLLGIFEPPLLEGMPDVLKMIDNVKVDG